VQGTRSKGRIKRLEATRTMSLATLTPVAPDANASAPAHHAYHERPHLRAIVRHLGLSILMANVVPGVLFYLCLTLGNISAALIAALAWCYGAMAWRLSTRRRTSGLLVITMIGLTAKTVIAFASGSTFVYFFQPAITDGLIAALFLSSLTTARPVVARLASDFYPMNDDLAGRPRIQKLFWNLTLLWAVICLTKAVVTLYLLESLSTNAFVAVKGLFILATIIAGTTVTLAAAIRVARSEGLLHRAAA
jgi:intracellular septation protein A